MLSSESLRVGVGGGIAEICFGTGTRGNALTEPFWADLKAVLKEIDKAPEVRAILLYSEGRHYCSGIDTTFLENLLQHRGDDAARSMERLRAGIMTLQDTLSAIEACRVPVITAVQGACMGAGVDMVAACDLIYVSEDAFFSIHETNIGLAADLGSLQRLPRRLPYGLVRELAYTGRRMPAAEAYQTGLASACLADHDAVLMHARKIASTIALKSPLAILGTKRALQLAEDAPVKQGLDYIATWNAGLSSIQDIATSLSAGNSDQPVQYKPLLP